MKLPRRADGTFDRTGVQITRATVPDAWVVAELVRWLEARPISKIRDCAGRLCVGVRWFSLRVHGERDPHLLALALATLRAKHTAEEYRLLVERSGQRHSGGRRLVP